MDNYSYNGADISNAELVNRDTLDRLMAKKKHKKIFRRIGYVLLSLILCLIFGVICMALFLKIESMEVSGNKRYTAEQIVSVSGIEVGQNLYAINKKAAKGFITEEYPYINDVTIRRELPSTLTFKVEEDIPRYYTEICGEYFVLSESLRVLERTFDIPQSGDEEIKLIPLLMSEVQTAVVGDELVFEKELVFEYISNFIQALTSHEMAPEITSIDMTQRYNIYVTYQDRFRIYMGDNTETAMKLTFAGLMIETFPQDKSGQVDAHDITVGSVILDN